MKNPSFIPKTLAWLSLTVLFGVPAWSAPFPGTLETKKARLQKLLEELRKEHGFPGATAAFVLADGLSATVATGFADVEEKRSMTPKSRMLAGSVGKTFVSATVLALAQEGLLGLDDPIARWFSDDDWFDNLPNGRSITVRHLLAHRAGLVDHVREPAFASAIRHILNPDSYFKPLDLVAFALNKKPLFEAGRGFSYTDTGYILLGLIIERVSGRTYYSVLDERILSPSGLEDTIPADRRVLDGLAAGYLAEDDPLGLPVTKTLIGDVLVFHPLNEWTGGGLASTSLDLARWAKRLYEGRALAKPYLEELVDCPATPESACYGLGVRVRRGPWGPTYGHSGWFPGYLTQMAYFPDHRLAVALQINTDHGQAVGRHAMRIVEMLVSAE